MPRSPKARSSAASEEKSWVPVKRTARERGAEAPSAMRTAGTPGATTKSTVAPSRSSAWLTSVNSRPQARPRSSIGTRAQTGRREGKDARMTSSRPSRLLDSASRMCTPAKASRSACARCSSKAKTLSRGGSPAPTTPATATGYVTRAEDSSAISTASAVSAAARKEWPEASNAYGVVASVAANTTSQPPSSASVYACSMRARSWRSNQGTSSVPWASPRATNQSVTRGPRRRGRGRGNEEDSIRREDTTLADDGGEKKAASGAGGGGTPSDAAGGDRARCVPGGGPTDPDLLDPETLQLRKISVQG